MRFRRLAPVVMALALVASACGDDATGPQIELTQQETAELFAAITAIFADFAELSAVNPGLSLSLMGIADEINETRTCSQGGSATATGTVDETETTIDLDVDVDFTDCGSQGFILGGALNFAGSGTADETSVELDLTIGGDLDVETEDGRTGACALELDFAAAATQGGLSFNASGTICGESFNFSD
jgi:hypothetical protein